MVSYGIPEVKKSAEIGAVATLMISNKALRKAKAEKNTEIDVMLKNVSKAKGEILIVSGAHDFGKQLEGIGGVAALNRYKLE